MTRTFKLQSLSIAILWSTVWCTQADATEPFFMGLGDLPGGSFSSGASGVSADGSVVVGGSSSTPGWQAFRWTQSGGMVGLGDFPSGDFTSSAADVSADRSVVVGYGTIFTFSLPIGPTPPRRRPFRWTQGSGMVRLDDPPVNIDTFAYGVSADGSVVVGSGPGGAFRWMQDTGMEGLGGGSGAYGVSADGSVVVGLSFTDSSTEAFRWTQASGMVGLGDLPGGTFYSRANDVSGDGSVVVGFSSTASTAEAFPIEAFRWTQSSGMVGLGILPGFFLSSAEDVSADGSVVVGYNAIFNSSAGDEAFHWDATHGMRSLRDVLVNDFSLGASLAGWTLRRAQGISADGRFVVGYGTNPNGNPEAWLARLAPAPTLLGDYDGNGTVGPEDYDVWKINFGSTTMFAADGNGDGTVNTADYTVWRNHLGNSLGAGSGAALPSAAPLSPAVPEPQSAVLLMLAAAGWRLRQRPARR